MHQQGDGKCALQHCSGEFLSGIDLALIDECKDARRRFNEGEVNEVLSDAAWDTFGALFFKEESVRPAVALSTVVGPAVPYIRAAAVLGIMAQIGMLLSTQAITLPLQDNMGGGKGGRNQQNGISKTNRKIATYNSEFRFVALAM